MKKKILILITISICFGLCINKVKAFDTGKQYYYDNVCGTNPSCSYYYYDHGVKYRGSSIKIMIHSADADAAYCLDSSASASGVNFLIRERNTDNTQKEGYIDAGLLNILGDGKYTGYDDYTSKTIAVRLLTVAFDYGRSNHEYYLNTALYYIDQNADLKSKYIELMGTMKNYSSDYILNDNTTPVLENAINLFYKGLEASYEFYKTGTSTGDNNLYSLNTSYEPGMDGENKYAIITRIYYVDLSSFEKNSDTISNFSITNSNYKMNLYWSYDNINYEILTSSKSFTKEEAVTNGKNGKIYIKIVSDKVYMNKEGCYAADFTINYKSPTISGQQLYYIGNGSYQRLIVVGEGSTGDISKVDNFNICVNTCTTDINMETDCIDSENSTNEYIGGSITASDDIQKCILNNVDDAGNSYELNSCNWENTLKSSTGNDYCDIFCKEDYDSINFSGIKYIDSGRYFQIGAKIAGTKSCYTSKIDYTSYITDIEKAQKEYTDAYDLYLKAQTALTTIVSANAEGCDGSTGSGFVSKGSYSGKGIVFDAYGQGTAVASSGTYSYGNGASCSDSIGSKTTKNKITYYCISSTCTDGTTEAQVKAAINADIASAKGHMEQAAIDMATYIGEINDCTDWQSTFVLNPEISYSYDETYEDKIDDSDKILSSSCGENGCKVSSATSVWSCNGELNEDGKYKECKDKKDIPKATIDKTQRTYIVCSTAGCTGQKATIPLSYYVKKTYDASATYITKNVFYNKYYEGKIIYSHDSLSEEELEESQVKLLNGLPVSISTSRGAHNFTFNIDKLGEYYSECTDDNLGRLATGNKGTKNSVINANSEKFKGEYVCHYIVNCPECEVTGEIITPTCEGTSCCKTCLVNYSLQLNFRSISSSNINPGDRNYGYNWNYNWSIQDKTNGYYGTLTEAERQAYGTIIREKAEDTISEIQETGDNAYSGNPILTVTLDSNLAKEIKSYNNSVKKDGGYANNSLKCYDYVSDSGEDTTEYKYIFCYSEALDEWFAANPDKFAFVDSRLDVNSRSSEAISKAADTEEGYWQVTKATITTNSVIGGPAWK